ncbi:MAG: 4Fe-4S binding protein, partial [Anaerolineaceae bacterium]|nr:4Fe-4S binding protein [Anaerolineaceae bacterium]
REQFYREARRMGVLFLEFDPERPPVVSKSAGKLQVQMIIKPGGRVTNLDTDLVVLSAGIEAEPGNDKLSQVMKLPLNEDRFYLEAHGKIRPVDFAADGIFLCGLAHSPNMIDESMTQAHAAAIRAVTLLAKKELTATPIIATVNPRLCSACGLCVEVCPYHARILEPGMKYAEVVDVLCQGCGACIVACPNKASQQRGFEFLQINAMIDASLADV